MTEELFYLVMTSILLTVLWIPSVIGQVMGGGTLKPEEYKTLRNIDDYPDWVRRADRAQKNLVEQFGAFAALIVVAHLTEVSTAVTAAAAAVYFWARIGHAVVMIAGVSILMARTVIYTFSFAALLVLAWEILAGTVFS